MTIHFIIIATVFLFYDPKKKKKKIWDKLCFFSANLTNFAILEIKFHQVSNVTIKLKKEKKKKPSMIWFLNKKMVLIFN